MKQNSKLESKSNALRYVDMCNGNTQKWFGSGLAPHYIHRKNYGKVPTYLVHHKQELLEAKKAREEAERAAGEDTGLKKLSKEEVNRMVNSLKINWNQVFSRYQSLPLQIDTIGKIKRKSSLEAQLKLLENDIQTLQRHDTIYIAETHPRSHASLNSRKG